MSASLGIGVKAAVAAMLIASLSTRFCGVVSPEPTTGGETDIVRGVKTGKAPSSRFYAQAKQARPLVHLGMSVKRAAFLQHAMVGLLGILILFVAARRLYGNESGWVVLGLVTFSLIDVLYTGRVMGIPHSSTSVAAAILCFSSHRRGWWAVGALFLASAFAHRYHSGLLVLCFGAAVVWQDVAEHWGDWRVMRRRLLDRAWVAAIAAAALTAWIGWLSYVYERSEFAHLTGHKNLAGEIVHHNLHFVRILFRNDPIVWTVIVASFVLVLRRDRGLFRQTLSYRSTAFVSPGLVLRWAATFVVALSVVRVFSGMSRQLAPAMPLLFLVSAPIVLAAWRTLSRQRLWLLAVATIALATMAVGTWELDVTKGAPSRGARLKRLVIDHFPKRNVQMLTSDHFIWSTGGYRVSSRHRRAPDLSLGGDRLFRFSTYEEEPVKLTRIEASLTKYHLDNTFEPHDLLRARHYYITPRPTAAELRAFYATLPARLRRASRVGPGL